MSSPGPSIYQDESLSSLMQACASISPITTPPSDQQFLQSRCAMPAVRPSRMQEKHLVGMALCSQTRAMATDYSIDEFILVPPQAVKGKFVLRPSKSARYSFHSMGLDLIEDFQPIDHVPFLVPPALLDTSMESDDLDVTMPSIISPPRPMANNGQSFEHVDEGDSITGFIPIQQADMEEGISMDEQLFEVSHTTRLPQVIIQPRPRTLSIYAEDLPL